MNNIQKLKIGKYSEICKPFISPDFPFSINHKNVMHLRPEQNNFPSAKSINHFLNKSKTPIVLIITTNKDNSFPLGPYMKLLSNKKLKAIITHNPSIIHPKIYPLPIGAKWQYKSTLPFGESKRGLKQKYLKNCAKNSLEAFNLFKRKRKLKIWMRPMKFSVGNTTKYYRKFSKALFVNRRYIKHKLSKLNIVESTNNRLDAKNYFNKLKNYRFVISPHGNGLDSHGTWEALMSGCIPIVPSSPLNEFYKKLPVWIVNSWDEVNEINARKKEFLLLNKLTAKDFELVFFDGLYKYYNEICK